VRRPFLLDNSQAKGWKGLIYNGGLGHWLFTTSIGWQTYVGFLILWLSATSTGLTVLNRLMLMTGVYKFQYPLTLTLLQLSITHILLLLTASLSRLLAPWLNSAGLSAMVAPSRSLQTTTLSGFRGTGKKSGRLMRLFTGGSGGIAGGGLFEFEYSVARQVIPLAIIYIGKVSLSNISFAYALLPMYLLARIAIVPLSLVLTATLGRTPHSIAILSSVLTATLNLLMATARSGIRVTWESIVAGIFSSLFVALFPVQLQRTYRNLVSDLVPQADLIGFTASYTNDSADTSGSKEESRATWRLLHYTSLLSVIVYTPIVVLSGEIGDISRNCYFLDVFFHWFMVISCSVLSWGTFIGTVALVKATSPLTTTFMFIPRSLFLLVTLSKFRMPTHSWVGAGLCLASCLWFLRSRRKEGRFTQNPRASS